MTQTLADKIMGPLSPRPLSRRDSTHLLYTFSHAPYAETKSRPHESRGRVSQRIRTMFFRTRPAGQSTPMRQAFRSPVRTSGKHYLYAQGVSYRPRPKMDELRQGKGRLPDMAGYAGFYGFMQIFTPARHKKYFVHVAERVFIQF